MLKKRIALAVIAIFMFAMCLTGCNKEDLPTSLYTSDTDALASAIAENTDNSLKTPGDYGFTGEDVDFNLQGAGNTTFDDVGLPQGTAPAVPLETEPTGEYEGEPEFRPSDEVVADNTGLFGSTDAAVEDDTSLKNINKEDKEESSEDNDNLPDINLSDDTKKPTEKTKLPNTGIFLEDD